MTPVNLFGALGARVTPIFLMTFEHLRARVHRAETEEERRSISARVDSVEDLLELSVDGLGGSVEDRVRRWRVYASYKAPQEDIEQRLVRLETWLPKESEEKALQSDLAKQLKKCRQLLGASETEHERVWIVVALDELEEQVLRRLPEQGR